MNTKLKTFLLSLLTPGLGYLQNGDKKSFYTTLLVFYGVIVSAAAFRLFTTFTGLLIIVAILIGIYIFTAVRATQKMGQTSIKNQTSGTLKLCFTIGFIFITGLSFANRRTVLGFDIMSMNVPVMQPTILEGEKFLVNTWAYKRSLPKRGDIIIHSFNGQQGLYLNRIIALENDRIETTDGVVFVNGQKLTESYVLTVNVTKAQSKNITAIIIPEGNYFVMGDNRDASFGDSRFSGTITISNVVGKITDVISLQDKSRIGKSLK